MAEFKVMPGPLSGRECLKNAVCINTPQIYDSCRSKDCASDLRVYLSSCGQSLIDRAVSVRPKKTDIMCCQLDVEAVPFNKGFYSVDVKYFLKSSFDVFYGCGTPQTIEGVSVCSKRTILYGSEGSARIYSSDYKADEYDEQMAMKTNLPRAVIEVVDPIALSCRIDSDSDRGSDVDVAALSNNIGRMFGGDLVDSNGGNKLYVTVGIFSILRLERDTQLLIPSYDFYIPKKECTCGDEEDPCTFFNRISFPSDEFAPPQIYNRDAQLPCEINNCDCSR